MTNSDEAYNDLIERLGYPGSDRLRLVLKEMITPDQALMAAALPGTPGRQPKRQGLT